LVKMLSPWTPTLPLPLIASENTPIGNGYGVTLTSTASLRALGPPPETPVECTR
jgi:hypothetical protein